MKLIAKLKKLSGESQVKTALFAARLVLPVYESYFPDDSRVRNAVYAAADPVYAAYAADPVYAAADAARAVRHGVKAGAKKQTIYEFMERLSAS